MRRSALLTTVLVLFGCGAGNQLERPKPGSLTAPAGELANGSGTAPEENRVVILVNQNSAASREIGAYYAERRSIPSSHICRIQAPEFEETSREMYTERIEAPLTSFLQDGGLVESTLYVVTTLGLPLKIRGSNGADATAASVDSELTLLYGKIHGREFPLAGHVENPMFRQRDAEFSHSRFPVYLVTRLAAYDTAGVKEMIDRALKAENRGRVVLDLSSEDDGHGNNWLRTAAILLPQERLQIDESKEVLYDCRDVIGYGGWGSNDKNRRRRRLGFEWLPGAIASEFVSTNGRTFGRPPENWEYGSWEDKDTWFAGSPQGLTADLIEDGATGASGHVYEPYLGMTPRPEYLFPAYLGGRNLAESFYISIPGLSWMNIVVGDPLCTLGPPE